MKLKKVSLDTRDTSFTSPLDTSANFLHLLTQLTIPENLMTFTPAGTLPDRHLIEKPIPGMPGLRLTTAVLDARALFMLRLVCAELYLPVSFLTKQLDFDLHHPTSWAVYFAKKSCPGLLPVHTDMHDVFVFQAFGERTWEVDSKPYKLRPGDRLAIPLGTPHRVLSTEEDSLHVTLGVHYPTVFSLLREYTDSRRGRIWMAQLLERPADFEAHLDQVLKEYLESH